jgi:hypothetical protein
MKSGVAETSLITLYLPPGFDITTAAYRQFVAENELQQALPPYPAIIYGRFDPFEWAADPNRRTDFYDARQTGAAALSSTIKGFAGAAGCVEGIVRRIDRVEDGNLIQPGEFLVTTEPFPALRSHDWLRVFPSLC